MAESDVDLGTAAPTQRRSGRVREFVANRSSTQRIGVIGAVLILLTAPFGGLSSASEEDVKPLALGQKIDIGPFYVTVQKVTQVPDLEPAVSPEPGNRLLVIKVSATNHNDRAESADLVARALGGDHTAAVPWEGDDYAKIRAFDVDDAVELPAAELVNPGSTFTWALVLQQRADADLDALVLAVTGYYFQELGDDNLDVPTWVAQDTPLAKGHLDVEVQQ